MHDLLAEWRPAVDETIERILPRELDEEHLAGFFGEPTYRYDAEAIQRALVDPIWDLLDRGGKRWRAVLFLLLVEAFGEAPEAYLEYACVPEILHNGTIIVDDVEDDADLRRGEPALHRIYGTDVALNAGNAMYFVPLKLVGRNPGDLDAATRLRVYEMLMAELNRTHLGQGMDIVWHNRRAVDATEEEYLEMCACKTGCLGRIVARLAAIVTGSEADEEHVARYAESMSVAFQIADDVLDVEYATERGGAFGKGAGNDVREGKKTLMVIRAVRNGDPETAARLDEILAADENTDEEVLEAVEILRSTGAVESARGTAHELAAEARDHLERADIDPESAEPLTEFTRFVVDREV
ncbi:polyprenyl synthetase [Halobacteriales archaeon QS_5_70_15]|nr:MAG: polyprenyl synthetase [Halobacteriales archaeon QS_5_70_15]